MEEERENTQFPLVQEYELRVTEAIYGRVFERARLNREWRERERRREW